MKRSSAEGAGEGSQPPMKIVLLTSDSPNQVALANKLASIFEVAVIVVSKNVVRRRHNQPIRFLLNRIAGRTVGRPFLRAWESMQRRHRRKYPNFPTTEIVYVENVNDQSTLRIICRHQPRLVVVSGTNLLGRRIIAAVPARIVNLHTGISPYVKGGPNCTNWCLALARFDLIGNTVMWLDAGVDSGAIITTERTALTGAESLDDLHWKVMEHAHDLYLRALRRIANGVEVPAVSQSLIANGQTFHSADWGPVAMLRAWRNFQNTYHRSFSGEMCHEITLVSLP
jgi:methionyl-tRNA formyltransferase